MSIRNVLFLALTAVSTGVTACDNGPTAGEDSNRMTFAFAAVTNSTAASAAHGGATAAADEIVLTGSNGVLSITGVFFIVDEFKLGRDETPCEDTGEGEDDHACAQFETGPAFVELPLDGITVPVFTAPVPAGTYVDLKFEVKDAGPDEGGSVAGVASLLEDIAVAGFSNWPGNASLAVVGTFTPTGGATVPFTVFLDAEVKVEMALEPPLVIEGETGTASVQIDPALWFMNEDGTVLDLSAFDFTASGDVLEFESKLVHGFTKLELEGFDD